ncbi:MAG: aldo/keto reductase [Limisphaerales bacterium]
MKTSAIETLTLRSGREIPMLGQGTWRMGENRSEREAEIAGLQLGLDLGLTLIDTAEMYGEGGAEMIVGEAMAGRRDEVFLVSKVYPHHACREGTAQACERSLKRLKTDRLELYLLHWRESVPLDETVEAFLKLKADGKILDFGVSNFDLSDMEDVARVTGGDQIVTNQVYYNLEHRGIEFDLMPWCKERGIPLMAYSPLKSSGDDRHALLERAALKRIAKAHNATTAQIALAWLLGMEVVVIPKAVKPKHVRENRAVADIQLTREDLKALDKAFPPPTRKVALAMR